MSLSLAAAIYLVCWWIVLFAILPIGVRTQQEAGAVEPGTPESAPVTTHLRYKLAATTVVAAVVFALVYVMVVYKPIALDDIPYLPRFEPHRP